MKITITNDGVGQSDVVTIFVRHLDGTTENYTDIEHGQSLEITVVDGDRYEVVPWQRT